MNVYEDVELVRMKTPHPDGGYFYSVTWYEQTHMDKEEANKFAKWLRDKAST